MKYDRLFAFGCSFTGHSWPTWANILGYEYDILLYNYGRGGAGNQYIFNSLMQADSFSNFTENDLVIITWTNVSREDRYKNNSWLTPGNIFSQNTYDQNFVINYADFTFFGLRDFAAIKASIDFLKYKKCKTYFFKMAEFTVLDQWNNVLMPKKYEELLDFYKPYLDQISPSFYQVLWDNNVKNKLLQEQQMVGKYYKDGHPFVTEHAQYLQKTMGMEFSQKTLDTVNLSHEKILNSLRKENEKEKPIQVWTMDWQDAWFHRGERVKVY